MPLGSLPWGRPGGRRGRFLLGSQWLALDRSCKGRADDRGLSLRGTTRDVAQTTHPIASRLPTDSSLCLIESQAAVNKIGRYKIALKSLILHMVTDLAKYHDPPGPPIAESLLSFICFGMAWTTASTRASYRLIWSYVGAGLAWRMEEWISLITQARRAWTINAE